MQSFTAPQLGIRGSGANSARISYTEADFFSLHVSPGLSGVAVDLHRKQRVSASLCPIGTRLIPTRKEIAIADQTAQPWRCGNPSLARTCKSGPPNQSLKNQNSSI